MKKRDAVQHFGSEANIARLLKISRQAVSKWGEVIPIKSAARLAQLAKRLDIGLEDYE